MASHVVNFLLWAIWSGTLPKVSSECGWHNNKIIHDFCKNLTHSSYKALELKLRNFTIACLVLYHIMIYNNITLGQRTSLGKSVLHFWFQFYISSYFQLDTRSRMTKILKFNLTQRSLERSHFLLHHCPKRLNNSSVVCIWCNFFNIFFVCHRNPIVSVGLIWNSLSFTKEKP